MQEQPSAVRTPRDGPDLRRVIPRQTWLANRAGNALRRPFFIGAIGVATFVTALVSMVVAVSAQRKPPRAVPVVPRPDTLALAAGAAMGRVRLVQAESALVVARAAAADTTATEPDTEESAPIADSLARDSIAARIKLLDAGLTRAEQAPLLSSYRVLADLPELKSDARVRALLDTLADIEREREGFGAVGGVDPIFVALTSRANEVGRAIQAIARVRRRELDAQLSPAAAIAPAVAVAPAVDTAAPIALRDSLRTAIDSLDAELARRREATQKIELAERQARERANSVAPTLALLASAFVLSWALGFAVAFVGELKRPRVSRASELERFLGVRVLSSVETQVPSEDRGRREADRAAPPYVDPATEGYQLAYLGLAIDQPTLLVATVTGDDPTIAAVVACNLAAVAADEARTTLLLDLEPSARVSSALRARATPGVSDIATGGISWPDATAVASIGRDKTVGLVPYGSKPATSEALISLLKSNGARLGRYYDAIFIHAAATDVAVGLSAALPSSEVIYCAQPGLTPLRQLRAQLERIRAAGGSIRGVVLWAAERPTLAAPPIVREASPTRKDTERGAARQRQEAHSGAST